MRFFFEVCWRTIDRLAFGAAYIVTIGFWMARIWIAVCFRDEMSWVEKTAEGLSGGFLLVIVLIIDLLTHKRRVKP